MPHFAQDFYQLLDDLHGPAEGRKKAAIEIIIAANELRKELATVESWAMQELGITK